MCSAGTDSLAAINAYSGTVEYYGTTVTGRYLRGNGIQRIVSGALSRLNAVTTFNSTRVVNDGTATFDVFRDLLSV